MEDSGIALAAVGSAKRWLASAKAAAGIGSYDSALYALEMSIEISLKAVLFSLGMDVPKSHAIGDVFSYAVKENRSVPKELRNGLDGILDTFNALLELRAASGYIFETKTSLEGLKAKYDRYVGEVESASRVCEASVKSVLGK